VTTLGIIGAATGVLGFIISVLGYLHNRIEAINAYFENDRSETFLKAREIIHGLEEDYNLLDLMKNYGNEVAYLIISYNQAGLLVKRKQLPFWIFSKQASSGYAIIRLWEKLEPYIKMRRDGDGKDVYRNPAYAVYFEYLYKRVKKAKAKYNLNISV